MIEHKYLKKADFIMKPAFSYPTNSDQSNPRLAPATSTHPPVTPAHHQAPRAHSYGDIAPTLRQIDALAILLALRARGTVDCRQSLFARWSITVVRSCHDRTKNFRL